MMTQDKYRLPEMSGPVRDMFGQFLLHEADHERRNISDNTAQYMGTSSVDAPSSKEAPHSALPVVDANTWEAWQQVFTTLDKNEDGEVQVSELIYCGHLSVPVCHALVKFIQPEDKDGFTRAAFLDAMLKAHDCRAPAGHETAPRLQLPAGNEAVSWDGSISMSMGIYQSKLKVENQCPP